MAIWFITLMWIFCMGYTLVRLILSPLAIIAIEYLFSGRPTMLKEALFALTVGILIQCMLWYNIPFNVVLIATGG